MTEVYAHRGSLGVASGPACEPTCITCGDVAVEVRVVRMLPHAMAVVTTDAGDETVSVALVDAAPGDTVLVHAGEALAVVSKAPRKGAEGEGAVE